MGSESLIGKPSENEVNLSSISLGSQGSEMNYFKKGANKNETENPLHLYKFIVK